MIKFFKRYNQRYKLYFITLINQCKYINKTYITKSGSKTNIFFNFSKMNSSCDLFKLGQCYRFFIKKIIKNIKGRIVIFTSPYKGIPIVFSIIQHFHRSNIHYCFNRKEKKDHGEEGLLVGCQLRPSDTVIIVDDVITSGQSIMESITLLKKYNIPYSQIYIIVGIDRQDKSFKDKKQTAMSWIKQEFKHCMQPKQITSICQLVNNKLR